MTINIVKNGQTTICETLNVMRNLGKEIKTGYDKDKGVSYCDLRCNKVGGLIDKFFGIENETPSKKLIKFLCDMQKQGLIKEETKTVTVRKNINNFIDGYEEREITYFIFEFELEKMGYALFKGEPFGLPKFSYGIKLPFLNLRYTPNTNEYYHEDFGNEFNGGSTIHPTSDFEVESLADAVGTKCKTEYRSPGSIDGWGCGFKGGFYVVKK